MTKKERIPFELYREWDGLAERALPRARAALVNLQPQLVAILPGAGLFSRYFLCYKCDSHSYFRGISTLVRFGRAGVWLIFTTRLWLAHRL